MTADIEEDEEDVELEEVLLSEMTADIEEDEEDVELEEDVEISTLSVESEEVPLSEMTANMFQLELYEIEK
jgi:hypothetical protein